MPTHNPTTAAEIITAINDAVDGDTVNLPAGTYDCTATDLEPAPGVTIQGQGMGRTIIQGRMRFDGTAAATTALILQNWTLDCEGEDRFNFSPCQLQNGTVRGYRWRVTNGTYAGVLSVVCCVSSGSVAYDIKLYDCEFDHGIADVFATKAGTGVDTSSTVQLFRCSLHHAGTGASDQLATGHGALVIQLYGCRLTNPGTTSHHAVVDDGTAPAIVVGCKIVGRTDGNLVLHNDIDCDGGYYGIRPVGANPVVQGNRLYNMAGPVGSLGVIQAVGTAGSTCLIDSNLIIGDDTGITAILIPSAVAAGTFAVRNNTIVNCRRGIDSRGGASLTATTITNNAITVTAEAGAYAILGDNGSKVTGDYNTYNGSLLNHAAGANDINEAPEMDGHYRPTRGGNCDGNGDATTLGSTVDADRHPRGAAGSLVSRGALERDWNLHAPVRPAPHVVVP